MQITFDPAKDAINLAKHGVSLALAANFEWGTAVIQPDQRHNYGEQRFKAFGAISDRLFCLVFTPRGESVRIISLRKANKREVKIYESQNNHAD